MKAPLSWLGEHADLPAGIEARAVADALVAIGLEIEQIDVGAQELSGPIVVGQVLSLVAEPQRNGKVINWCQVDVGEPQPRGIVCGAHNFGAGDLVVAALPGAQLPGGFAISARKTYGHVSDGMICSVRELGVGEDHDGILVLPSGTAAAGADAVAVLGLAEAVLDVAVTTDRGYCLSIRGLARETSTALGVGFTDVVAEVPEPDGAAVAVTIDDPAGCDRFSARSVTGLDPAAPTPDWMARRLRQCGMRPVSLAVDVTNYVMLETGQPLHAFDAARLRGGLTVRRAVAGESLTTLDGQLRVLTGEDLVVADDSGALALAGVMGGASTEIGPDTTDVVLEAAHWTPDVVARTVRRHRLPSEAARRFERGVDPAIAGVALARCVQLLEVHGAARAVPGYTVVADDAVAPPIELDAGSPARIAGMDISRDDVIAHLQAVGCDIAGAPERSGGDMLQVRPASWRPDLLIEADLVEEVVRLAGYQHLPSRLPLAQVGTGLTPRQRLLRSVTRALADAGCVEVLSFPFVSPSRNEELGLTSDGVLPDGRRPLTIANPLSADEPLLRTSVLPGLVGTALRNVGRGNRDLALFETGSVFLPTAGASAEAVAGPDPTRMPPVDRRPSPAELDALDATLPAQPRHLGVILCGEIEQSGWWGPGRAADWTDALELARLVARTARAPLAVQAAQQPPWHPGRCAALTVSGVLVGHAGELHPRVVDALGLPIRSCALELDLDALTPPGPAVAPAISSYPPALLDIALVVPAQVPTAQVEATVRRAAGPLLESVRLFDVYADDARLGPGKRSLAWALKVRADDRTLTTEEAGAVRDAVVAAARAEHGAQLRF